MKPRTYRELEAWLDWRENQPDQEQRREEYFDQLDACYAQQPREEEDDAQAS